VAFSGKGIHTGDECNMVIKPAAPGFGIAFQRVDLAGKPVINATIDNVVSTQRCTALGVKGVRISTVEHLLAALGGLRIDNALICLDSDEVPAGDGSATVFVNLLREAGIEEQGVPARYICLTGPQFVSVQGRHLVAIPNREFSVSFTFVSSHPAVGNQYAEFVIDEEVFEREIAPARTVAFLDELQILRQQGLALGGSMEMAVVVGKTEILNSVRFEDEIVRHKILDIVGDLALLAGRLKASIIGIRSGHQMNAALARKLESTLIRSTWDWEQNGENGSVRQCQQVSYRSMRS